MITTSGLRDALEMRRGIREEQYNNRYTNVAPLVPRYLRLGVGGRLDHSGAEIEERPVRAFGQRPCSHARGHRHIDHPVR